MKRSARARLALALGLPLLGCASQSRPEPPKKPQPPALHAGPLADFVPAAGLRWLALGRPRELAASPHFAAAAQKLLPEIRLRAYAQATGVELRNVPNGLIAGFDFATLYMAELRSGEALVETKFEERLVSGGVLHSAHPDLRKLTGIVGRTPETLLIARGQWLAVAVGDPTAARVAEGFALRRLKKSVPALRGSALSTLPAELEQAPLRFYAPGPFLGDWARAARGLLAESSAVGVSARPVAPDGLEVMVALGGVNEGSAAEREARLLGAWEDVAQSSTGHLLGLHEPLSAPRPKAGDGYVELRVALGLMTLARGLRAAVSADVSEILDVPASKPPGSSHLPTQKR